MTAMKKEWWAIGKVITRTERMQCVYVQFQHGRKLSNDSEFYFAVLAFQ